MSDLAVTVVVPTVDRVDLLRRCLRGLAGQKLDADYDVVVVHDGDSGVIALLDENFGSMSLRGVQISERGVSAKRNAGWRAATAPLVAFTDDDCEPTTGWLAGVVDAAADDDAMVAGPVAPHPDDADVGGLWTRTINSPTDAGFYPGCNLALRRSALERVDGFDEALSAGEDTDLAWRAIESGSTPRWADSALVWHAVRAVTFAQQLRSLPRWSSLPLVVQRHPHLRDRLAYRRYFWKDSHPAACLALAGLALSLVDKRALAGVVPVLARRIRAHGPVDGAALAVNDVAEAAVVIAGSVRHGTVVL